MAKFVGWYMSKDWKKELPFYQFKCSTCKKTVINYPAGYSKTLYCPICINGDTHIKELIKKNNSIKTSM